MTDTVSVPRWARAGLAAFVVALVPLCFFGPGTDLDAGAVLLSGSRIVHGGYVASRAPGAPVHEALVGVLDVVGDWAPNLLSMVAAVALFFAVARLLAREGVPRPWLAAALIGASPWFQIASTSTVDFVAAIALLVGAALVLRRGHAVWAGVLCGLSVGMRMSGVLLVLALLAADATGHDPRWRRALRALVVAGVVSVLCFLPPYFAADESLDFARNDFTTSSPSAHLGRAFVKNLAYFGPLTLLLVAVAVPAVWQLRASWRDRFVVRFAALGFVVSEALFIRFPWKLGHLIPAMVCLALLLAEALRDRPRLFVAIILAQLSLGLVNIEFVRPNVPNAATSAELEVRFRRGPVFTDTACRRADTGAARSLDVERIDAVWNCAKPFGTGR